MQNKNYYQILVHLILGYLSQFLGGHPQGDLHFIAYYKVLLIFFYAFIFEAVLLPYAFCYNYSYTTFLFFSVFDFRLQSFLFLGVWK